MLKRRRKELVNIPGRETDPLKRCNDTAWVGEAPAELLFPAQGEPGPLTLCHYSL
jgi:hypothetical protein